MHTYVELQHKSSGVIVRMQDTTCSLYLASDRQTVQLRCHLLQCALPKLAAIWLTSHMLRAVGRWIVAFTVYFLCFFFLYLA